MASFIHRTASFNSACGKVELQETADPDLILLKCEGDQVMELCRDDLNQIAACCDMLMGNGS